MDDSNHTRREIRTYLRAAAWRTHLNDTGAQTTPTLERWLAADPEHRDAWERAEALWEQCETQANAPDILELRRTALAGARSASHQRWWRSLARERWTRRAIAAGVTLLLTGAASIWLMNRPEQYRTALGERREITLTDGSRISLDANSVVMVSLAEKSRELELVRGQARFEVAPDVERPFSVRAHGQKVVAIGTAFNVDILGNRLLVTLFEGKAVVLGVTGDKGIELKPGEQLTVNNTSRRTVAPVNLELANAWQHGELMFDNEPLSQVVERVNRYSERKIEVVGKGATQLTVSGIFAVGDVDRFVRTISEYLPLSAEPGRGGTIRLRSRQENF